MCAQIDVKKMLVQKARSTIGRSGPQSTNMKSGRREHGSNPLWLFCDRNWSEKHRNVARMIFLEGKVGRKRDCSKLAGRMQVNVTPARWRKAQKKHKLYHCPEWHEIRREISETFRKWDHKARTSKREWKWQRGIVWPTTAPCW